MACCMACEAEIASGQIEIGEVLICGACGAGHEVLSLQPLELVLLEDEVEEPVHGGSDEEDLEDDDDDDPSAGPPAREAPGRLTPGGG